MSTSLGGCRRIAAGIALAIVPALLNAQAHYYNLDGGRPVRVEDAEPTARYSLDLDVAPFSVERLSGGTTRYRLEPKATYGILPFTDLEIRVPYVRVAPPHGSGANAATGVAGLAFGAMHAFNLETSDVPQVAIGTEVSLPVGTLAPSRTSFLAKLLVTKTTRLARIHVNAGAGTYAVKATGGGQDSACAGGVPSPLRIPRAGQGCSNVPIIVDTPCDLRPSEFAVPSHLSAMCMPPSVSIAAAVPSSPPTFGRRWFVGTGLDHAFPLSSLLLNADIFAERFEKLYSKTDWTTELGARKEMTPSLVLDTGIGWHFAGVVPSISIMFGATYELGTPPLTGR